MPKGKNFNLVKKKKKKLQVSSTQGSGLVGCEQYSLVYKFLSQALRSLENTFQASNKTRDFPGSLLRSLSHFFPISPHPFLPLSLPPSLPLSSCTKYLFD